MVGRKDLWVALRFHLKEGHISKQEYNTYKGQILKGEEDACIRGLKRKGLIKEVED